MSSGTRTLLMHALRNWPEIISTILWPYAWKEVERRMNLFGFNQHGDHPECSFGNLQYSNCLKDQHTWGCPVYVLSADAREQRVPKWDARARVGVYLGHSPAHAGSVALVLNPKTLHVSPQYHVVYDDTFSTVPFLRRSEMPPNWTELCLKSREIATSEDFVNATKGVDGDAEDSPSSDSDLKALNSGHDVTTTLSLKPNPSYSKDKGWPAPRERLIHLSVA